MLTQQEIHEIRELAHSFPNKQAAAPEALHLAQHTRGWISDEILTEIAALLDMSAHELDSVATFFNHIFRRPVGKHVIRICDSVSCYIMGYGPLLDYLQKRLGIRLGQTTPDGLFSLIPNACLGACDKAPTMMVDTTLHIYLTKEKIDVILKELGATLLPIENVNAGTSA